MWMLVDWAERLGRLGFLSTGEVDVYFSFSCDDDLLIYQKRVLSLLAKLHWGISKVPYLGFMRQAILKPLFHRGLAATPPGSTGNL